MAAFRIFSRFAELLDIAVTRAAPAWLRLNTDGTYSERSAAQTLSDIGAATASHSHAAIDNATSDGDANPALILKSDADGRLTLSQLTASGLTLMGAGTGTFNGPAGAGEYTYSSPQANGTLALTSDIAAAQPPDASQAEMELGSETALRAMSPLRVKQAVEAVTGTVARAAAATTTAATTQNVWFNTDVAMVLTAGTWRVNVFGRATNATSSSAQFGATVSAGLSAAANETLGVNSLSGTGSTSSTSHLSGQITIGATRGDVVSVLVGTFVIVMTTSGTLTLQIRNTAATGTSTCTVGTHLIATKL